jgi:hypothetical protein
MRLIELTRQSELLLIGLLFLGLVMGASIAVLPRTFLGKALLASIVVVLFIAFPGRWKWEVREKLEALLLIALFSWTLVIGALTAALPKTLPGKVFAASIVVALFIAFPGRWAWETRQNREAERAHYQKIGAMFQEGCKKAGVFIYRTAENVEAVFLRNYHDQYKMECSVDSGGDGYIETFLRARNKKGHLDPMKVGGYRYVDVIDPKDGQRYRYTGGIKTVGKAVNRDPDTDLDIYRFVLDRIPAPGPGPRYSVVYDDISTHEERDNWIVGGALRIIDLKTNDVMAEHIGYRINEDMAGRISYRMSSGHGHGGLEAAWLRAIGHACPIFVPERVWGARSSCETSPTRDFVEKVLQPIPEK